tara:strand:+ start:709 stop:996 length:288 start_codon:yes stop_codon:yes gene_type:complete
MDSSNDDVYSKQRESLEFLEKDSNESSMKQKDQLIEEKLEVFHLNSLITKNISLFTKDPNYKLLAWLIVQLFIFSLFVLVVTFMKNNLVPYLNSF